ncbi:unannotated protein [freshwater metagenome]|uniref:Unannotated protein n=1 Tax=freshwater metagenome TaxID=449393 RepID=A0A6J6I769_9ZZZZ
MTHTRSSTGEFADRVADHHTVEIGVAEGPDRLHSLADKNLGSGIRSLDHCRQCNGALGGYRIAPEFVDRRVHRVTSPVVR